MTAMISFTTSPEQRFHLSFLPKTIALFGGDHFQFFTNEEDLDSEDLKKIFPDEATIVRRAKLHKVGHVDKEVFLYEVQTSLSLSTGQRAELTKFIMECDCAPSTVRAKLKTMGYEPYIDRIVIERRSAELEVSIGLINHVLSMGWDR